MQCIRDNWMVRTGLRILLLALGCAIGRYALDGFTNWRHAVQFGAIVMAASSPWIIAEHWRLPRNERARLSRKANIAVISVCALMVGSLILYAWYLTVAYPIAPLKP